MAHFLSQPKGQNWCKPDYHKLDLTRNEDKAKLSELRLESENVYKISFTDFKDKTHAIVDGQLVAVYAKSRLKVEILDLAVQKLWTYEETMRALYELKPSERKQILKAAQES